MFNKVNIGPMPPPLMLLSDGGHVENLALLPLLKKRLKKIIVVDGGFKNDEKSYGKSLLDALMLARKKLNCSFLSEEGGDVISDLLDKFVKPTEPGNKRRFYRFVVLFLFRLLLLRLITNEEKLHLYSIKKCAFHLSVKSNQVITLVLGFVLVLLRFEIGCVVNWRVKRFSFERRKVIAIGLTTPTRLV